MGLATIFKLSIYGLTAFVGLALGAAEQGPIPFVSLPITLIAYWWCETGQSRDRSQSRGLGESAAVGMGCLALLASVFEFFADTQEGKLLAGIHLVVYLTWIVLLQKKTIYRYWLLMALGIMHVAVGSVLTNSTWYGMCMIAYLFGSIWTLSIFSLYRVANEFADSEVSKPLIEGSKPKLRGLAFNAIRFEDHASWISMRLFSGVLFTSVAGLAVSIAFFILIPRVWVGSALGISDESLPPAMRGRMTGQATEITLGDFPILESNDPALSIKLFDVATNKPVNAQNYAASMGMREPLFRGAVLTDYSDGRWKPERIWSAATTLLPAMPDDPLIKTVVPTIRQEIHLERLGTDILPCLGHPVAMRDPEGYRCGRMQSSNNLVVRRDWFKSLPGAVDYIAYTPAPGAIGEQGLVATAPEMVVYRISNYLQRCSELSKSQDRLKAYTVKLLEAAQRTAGKELSDEEKARFLERHLRDSGDYVYSLDSKAVDALSDPVEDFVFRRKAGHCQYFASALALMMRSAGIPARLATGFKGGEDLPTGELNVEKRFAHVWVEAWVGNRKWMTFDATPEDGRAESVTAVGSKRNLFTSMTARLAGIWESNVLDISYERQNDVIYRPLRELVNSIVQTIRDFWDSPQTALLGILLFLIDPRNWLTVPGAIMLATLASLLWFLRRKSGWFRWDWRRKQSQSLEDDRRRIEFYERFVRLMATHGHQRQLSQTQREFVAEMADTFSVRLADLSVSNGLGSVSDFFYAIRFGNGELTERQLASVDELLSKLEQTLGADQNLQPA